MSPILFLAWLPVVIVILSAVGLALMVLGVRGQPIFSSPRCAKCGYDLRNVQFMSSDAAAAGNCPECGNELARIGAVSFGKWQRQPKRIVWGVALLLVPWVLTIAAFVVARSRPIRGATPVAVGPQAKAQMTTPALLASLQGTVSQPWDWQELERRLKAGQLTQADVDGALGVLIADLAARRAKSGRREPIHWADDFLKAAIAGGNASPQQVAALAQAFYGTDPKFTMRSRARENEPLALTLNQYEPWDLSGMKQVWSLAGITANGTIQLAPQKRNPGTRKGQPPPPMQPDELSGTPDSGGEIQLVVPHALPPGEHEITITRDVGIVDDTATMRGLDGKPGTPDKWPAPAARWQSVVKKKVTIVPRDAPVLEIVTDANTDPFKTGTLAVEQALVRPASQGKEIVLKFKSTGNLTPLLSYRVSLQPRGGGGREQKIEYGTVVIGGNGYHSATAISRLKELPADVTLVDLLFEVDQSAAERFVGVEQIWGNPHVIRNVKLERFDLSPSGGGGNDKTPATQPG